MPNISLAGEYKDLLLKHGLISDWERTQADLRNAPPLSGVENLEPKIAQSMGLVGRPQGAPRYFEWFRN